MILNVSMVNLSTKSREMNYDTVWRARVVKKDKISLIQRIYMLIYIGNYEELEHCRIAGESVKVTLIKFNACI